MEGICQDGNRKIRRAVLFLDRFRDLRELDRGVLKFVLVGTQKQENILTDFFFFLHKRTASAKKQRIEIQIAVALELHVEVVHAA